MKKTNGKRTVIIALILFSMNYLYSQNEKSNKGLLNNNAIYGSVGSGGLYFTATAYYERILKQQLGNKNISTFLKFGYGTEADWGGVGTYILAQFGFLTGTQNSHFEFAAGGNYFISGDLELPISASAGWRFQKPEGKFIFRTGIALPEAIYVGLGFSF